MNDQNLHSLGLFSVSRHYLGSHSQREPKEGAGGTTSCCCLCCWVGNCCWGTPYALHKTEPHNALHQTAHSFHQSALLNPIHLLRSAITKQGHIVLELIWHCSGWVEQGRRHASVIHGERAKVHGIGCWPAWDGAWSWSLPAGVLVALDTNVWLVKQDTNMDSSVSAFCLYWMFRGINVLSSSCFPNYHQIGESRIQISSSSVCYFPNLLLPILEQSALSSEQLCSPAFFATSSPSLSMEKWHLTEARSECHLWSWRDTWLSLDAFLSILACWLMSKIIIKHIKWLLFYW